MMAARKRNTRSNTRRSTKQKSVSNSFTSILVLGAILGLGVFSLWATANHKSPQDALVTLFKRNASELPVLASVNSEVSHFIPAKQDERTTILPKAVNVAPQPVSRPPSAAAPVIAPQMVDKLKVVQPAQKPDSTSATSTKTVLLTPPTGKNIAANSPSVVYASSKLTVHKNAWDQSPSVGTVEKGREMRSYGKTGRWHRVVVPSTNIIGWVHEARLRGAVNKHDSTNIVTGSIDKKPQMKSADKTQKRIEPPRSVGAKN